jgi:anti-sigma B factor antagonist
MSTSLVITQRTIGRVTIVVLSGALLYDDEGERLFRDQITALVASGDKQILIDLNQVTHMDSGSVGTLVAVHLHTLKRGGSIKLLNPSERVTRVLHITRLESIFDIFPTEAEALRVMHGRHEGHEVDEGDEARRTKHEGTKAITAY